MSQQQQCAGEAALTTAAFLRLSPAAAGAGLLYNCYPLSQCSYSSNLVITIYYLLSRYWFEIIFDGFIYCTVFSMILIRWSNKYFPKFIHISISASNLDNIQYNLYVYPSISRGQHRQQKMQSQTSGSQQGQYSPAPRFRWNDSDPFFILVSCFFIWSLYFFIFLFISLSSISEATFSYILF